jgi:hypothetical protein
MYTQVDKIRITRFLGGIGKRIERFIEDQREIDKILRLINRKTRKCSPFIDSPQLARFRIELYEGEELLTRIVVAGNFFHRDTGWYSMRNSLLQEELMNYTEGVLPTELGSCSFK